MNIAKMIPQMIDSQLDGPWKESHFNPLRQDGIIFSNNMAFLNGFKNKTIEDFNK
jgi:hypothetical protein